MKLVASIWLSCLFLSSLLSQNITIHNVNVVDVKSGSIIAQQDVIVKEGIIKSIHRSQASNKQNSIDGTNKYLIPGLIDSHIHLFQSGGLYTRPDGMDYRHIKPYEEERQWVFDHAEDILRRYLSLGITSVIDIGGPMYNYPLRDSLNQISDIAHTYLTGPLISTYLPSQLDVDQPPIIVAKTKEEGIQLVKKQLPYKPDFIKIWYVTIKPQDALDNQPMIHAVIQEAKKHHLPVAVHATSLTTAKLALQSGADFLVHSVSEQIADSEFIQLLQESDAVYSPTLQVSGNYNNTFFLTLDISELDYDRAPPIPLGSLMDLNHLPPNEDLEYYKKVKDRILDYQRKRDSISLVNLSKVYQSNLPIAMGTDAGNIGTLHASSVFKEIQLMKDAGLSNADILKASTIHAAATIKKDNQVGSIDIGKRADLVLLQSNPLENLDALSDISDIFRNGKQMDVATLHQASPEQLVQQQLNAYNGHHLEAFLKPYADSVKIYNFPNELLLEGKSKMREQYTWIEKTPNLHCELVNRTILGNTVIDHERIVFDPNRPKVEAIAVYKINKGEIVEVYFMR